MKCVNGLKRDTLKVTFRSVSNQMARFILCPLFIQISRGHLCQSSPRRIPRHDGKAEEEERQRQEAERARAEAEAHERAERERQEQAAAEAAERERKAKEEAEAAERERRTREEEAKKANGKNESSTQLKMMLGLPSETAAPALPAAPVSPTSGGKETKKSKNSGKNRKSKEPQQTTDASSAAAKSAAPAWGGASQPVKRKSMAEIQKEEARASAIATMQQKGTRSSSSGWANVAASRGGSTAWTGTTAKQTPAAVLSKPGGMSAPVQRAKSTPASTPANRQQAASSSSQPKANVSSSTPADDFGAKMSPAFEKWCKDQMEKLNGTDDLTLVSFCMTLNDASEIRQYLTAYLGSTPQVNSFATEFINRKGGNAAQQEQWETTATSKKSKKKKGGGR